MILRWLTERRRRVLLARPFTDGWLQWLAANVAAYGRIRVTIAGSACQMILGRDHDLFADVDSILVYPTSVWTRAQWSSSASEPPVAP